MGRAAARSGGGSVPHRRSDRRGIGPLRAAAEGRSTSGGGAASQTLSTGARRLKPGDSAWLHISQFHPSFTMTSYRRPNSAVHLNEPFSANAACISEEIRSGTGLRYIFKERPNHIFDTMKTQNACLKKCVGYSHWPSMLSKRSSSSPSPTMGIKGGHMTVLRTRFLHFLRFNLNNRCLCATSFPSGF